MSIDAKKAREAMKAKAKRLAGGGKDTKVDSSDWKPAEPLNADVKTGMRPISRRAYKSGGKVEGEASKKNAGRAPRANGGKAKAYANALVNRNAKSANEEREGIKHVGGFKKGGRTSDIGPRDKWDESKGKWVKRKPKPAFQGSDKEIGPMLPSEFDVDDKFRPGELKRGGRAKKKIGGAAGDILGVLSPVVMAANLLRGDKDEKARGGRTKKAYGGRGVGERTQTEQARREAVQAATDYGADPRVKESDLAAATKKFEDTKTQTGYKKGGRTKKMAGGPMGDPRLGIVKDKAMEFAGNPVTPGLKKGGKVKHEDEAADKALIKKMVKPEARKEKASGGKAKYLGAGRKGDPERDAAEKEFGPREEAMDRATRQIENEFSPASMRKMRADIASRRAGNKDLQAFAERRKKQLDDESMEKSGYKAGGRSKRATGGMIEDSKKALMIKADPHNQSKIKPAEPKKEQAEAKACGGRMKRKSGGRAKGKTNINIVISGAGGGQPAPAGAPMPMPPPDMGPAPQATMPQGGPPQGMDPAMMAMLMQQRQQQPMPAPMPRKSGGRVTKVAKSYKDMEAGAGSGEGRLQKTDIAKRTNTGKKESGEKTFSGKGYPNKVPGATGGRTAHKAGGKVYRSYKDMDAGAGSGEGRLEKTEIAKRKK